MHSYMNASRQPNTQFIRVLQILSTLDIFRVQKTLRLNLTKFSAELLLHHFSAYALGLKA